MFYSLISPVSKLSTHTTVRSLEVLASSNNLGVKRAGLHSLSVLMMDGKTRGGGGRGQQGADRRMTREAVVLSEREKFLSMPVEEKRKQYKCGSKYSTLNNVPTWSKLLKSDKYQRLKKGNDTSEYRANISLNEKISIWKGDITKLEIDGIANAANNSLLGGGGVDGAIHSAAGSGLREECSLLSGCETGEAKITGGYKLPAKFVIHTVGPIGQNPTKLRGCYENCLRLLKENRLRSLAFPCISTGIYGYPNRPAANIALETIRKWLDTGKNSDQVDRIVFCLFLPADVSIYEDLMFEYFPPGADGEDSDPEADAAKGDAVSQSDKSSDHVADAETNKTEDEVKDVKEENAANDHEEEKAQACEDKPEEGSGDKGACETKAETDKVSEADEKR